MITTITTTTTTTVAAAAATAPPPPPNKYTWIMLQAFVSVLEEHIASIIRVKSNKVNQLHHYMNREDSFAMSRLLKPYVNT